ncbi:MAG TPA: hemin uptake protein HemP [Burkholderiales bacterium]|nr:hemin uptake protein HemP [Burkholderiales bacterium]
MSDQRQDESLTRASPKAAEPLPRVSSRQLLGAQGELVIEHQGREYRLRITQNGKLILTA